MGNRLSLNCLGWGLSKAWESEDRTQPKEMKPASSSAWSGRCRSRDPTDWEPPVYLHWFHCLGTVLQRCVWVSGQPGPESRIPSLSELLKWQINHKFQESGRRRRRGCTHPVKDPAVNKDHAIYEHFLSAALWKHITWRRDPLNLVLSQQPEQETTLADLQGGDAVPGRPQRLIWP